MAASKRKRQWSVSTLLALAVVLASGCSRRRRRQPTLTIYTYDSFAADYGPGPGLKAGFEKTCGCTVNFVATDSSIGALRRVQLEGTDDAPPTSCSASTPRSAAKPAPPASSRRTA